MSSRAPDETEYNNWPVLKVYTGKQYKGEDECIMLGVRKAAAICDQNRPHQDLC